MEKRKVVDDFEILVGPQCYESFLELLTEIGPDSRTERISVVIAGLLQFALGKASDDQAEGSLSEALANLEEDGDSHKDPKHWLRRHVVAIELLYEVHGSGEEVTLTNST